MQAAVIPVRRTAAGIEVCLIRKNTSARWGVPKGYVERPDAGQAALDEALEEAGLVGRLVGDAVGTYEYEKGPVRLTVIVYLMEVLEEQPTWREMRWRERCWYSIEEAGAWLKDHPVWALYDGIQMSRLARL